MDFLDAVALIFRPVWVGEKPSLRVNWKHQSGEQSMGEAITVQQMRLLQLVAKNPDVGRDKLMTVQTVTRADIDYLEQHDLIRQRNPDQFRISHLGTQVLKRGL
jgi:hypothetical protein